MGPDVIAKAPAEGSPLLFSQSYSPGLHGGPREELERGRRGYTKPQFDEG